MASGTPPRLPTAKFLDYLRAFNKRDYAAQHKFYSANVQLILPDPAIPALRGKEGIMTHYGPIHASADETVVPIIVMTDGKRVFLQMETYFQYKQEVQRAVHDYHVHKGDVIKITTCALYDIDEDGLMERIECHLFKQELLGQVDLKERIKESESRADRNIRLFNY